MISRKNIPLWLSLIIAVTCLLAGIAATQSITRRVTNGVQGLDGKFGTRQLPTGIVTDTTTSGGYFTISGFINSVSPAPIINTSFVLSMPS